jgi:hypothetical protein
MTIEATEVEVKTPPKGPKKLQLPPPPNAAVDEVAAGLDGIPTTTPAGATADEAVSRAKTESAARAKAESAFRVKVEARDPDLGENEPESADPYNPFVRTEAGPPSPTARERRETTGAERAKQNRGTPSTKRMGALGAKLPGAEHAKIHKRGEGGHLSLIGTVREKDMTRSQDMEAFVHEFMAPSYGPGLYQVTGVDAVGREFDMGIVDIAIPIGPPVAIVAPPAQDQSALGIIMKMMDQQNNQRQLPQPDPIDGLMKLHQLKQQMDPGAPQKDNATVLALIAGVTQVATAVLGVMMQPKAPDPLMALLLAKMMDDKPRRGSDLGDMPPPPPPAAIDPTEQLKNLAAVVTSLRGPERASGNDELIAYLLKDRMTPADVLNLVNQVKGERGTDDFKKSMENVGIMLNAAGQIRAQTEPGAGSGFWDAITAMLGNKELAGSVVQTMRGRQQGESQLPPQQQPRALGAPPPNDPLVIQARANAEKRLRLEAAELELREKKLSGVQVVVTPPPQVEARQLEQTETQSTEASPKERPKLPDNMGEFINAYLEAKTDEEYVEISVEMILSLGEHEDWKPYAEVILSFIANSDRARFLNYMGSFLTAMRTVGLMEGELAHKVMKALADNFPTLVEVVRQKMEGGDEEGEEGPEDDVLDVIKLGTEEPLTRPV